MRKMKEILSKLRRIWRILFKGEIEEVLEEDWWERRVKMEEYITTYINNNDEVSISEKVREIVFLLVMLL